MKRIALAAATALMLAGPLATTASAQNYDRLNRGDQSDQRGENRDRNDDRGGRRNDNEMKTDAAMHRTWYRSRLLSRAARTRRRE